MRRMVCELLASHGAEAVAAQDGQEAVRRFAQDGPFDAVLLDVCMPGMDGFAAARAIRRLDRQVLIFAHTEAGGRYGEQEARDSGMDGCLQKPVEMRMLIWLLSCAG